MIRVWLSLVVLTLPVNAFALEWKDLWQRNDQQAHELLSNGDPQSAATTFEDSSWRGISLHRAGEFEKATEEFSRSDDLTSLYNRGVAQVHAGQYDAAIEAFKEVLQAEPDHADAKHNLPIAELLQKQQEEQHQEQQQNTDDQQQDNNESDSPNEQKDQQQNQEQNQQQDQSQKDDSSESQNEGSDTQQSSQSEDQSGGELNEEDAEQSESAAEQAQTAQQELKESMQQQAQALEASEDDAEADDEAVQPGVQVTEEEQAAEQWLRRIPDDPSQLLRNKIKLNHMLEHRDVGDTREPW